MSRLLPIEPCVANLARLGVRLQRLQISAEMGDVIGN